MLARSVALRTAFFAVGEHTPAEQLICLVGLSEMFTAACAVDSPRSATSNATDKLAETGRRARFTGGPHSSRRIGEQIRISIVDARALAPDRGIEAGRQPRFQLGIGQTGDAGIVGDVAGTLTWIADTAGVEVPIVGLQHIIGTRIVMTDCPTDFSIRLPRNGADGVSRSQETRTPVSKGSR